MLSLDRGRLRQIVQVHESIRAIFVALVALSVAALPVAGGMARAAMSHDMTLAAGEGDCCHEGKPCEKKTERLRLDGRMRAQVLQLLGRCDGTLCGYS